MAKKDDKKLLETARKRFARCVDADQTNRRMAIEDMEFLHEPGEQWDEETRAERGKRPCYEFNKLRISCKKVINDIRQNRPQGKVRAVENGDKETANVVEGLCRNIWNVSDGDAAIDTAAEYQVGGGLGAWRVNTKYSTDDAWDQDIVIEPIRNPFALWADPSAKDPMKRDAEYWFLESRISEEAYEAKYGKVTAVQWEGSEFEDEDEWTDDGRIRLAEYWYRKPVTKTLALLDDGSTVDLADADPSVQGRILRTRQVQTHQICMAIISGDKVLEGPTEWAGSKFPFVQVHGEFVVLDGTPKWWGLARHAKDAQRLHNAMLTNALESAAANPAMTKWWATAKQAQGNTDLWRKAYKENIPFLVYNPDPEAGGPPSQMQPPQVPAAFIQLAMITSDEIKATTGIFDASLGNRSNEQTGVAIRARQQQGEVVNFNFADNMARGIRYTWELLIDLIPKIYDTARTIRVIGSDGAEDFAEVNQINPMTGQVQNDLSRGKYDVAITVGPSFSTQRQEAAEIYMGLAQANPEIMGIAGDLIFKAVDLPYAEDMAERLQTMLPPPVQQMLQAKDKSGKKMSPEAMQALTQANQMMQMVEQQSQLVQQAAAEADGLKSEAEKAMSELKGQQALLEADYQKMLADIAKREANLILKDASLTAKQTQDGVDDKSRAVDGEREKLSVDLQAALVEMQARMAEFMQQSANAIAAIQANMTPQVVVANEPRNKMVRVKRVNGELIGTVEEQ